MYTVSVTPQIERIDLIQKKAKNTEKKHRFFEYQNIMHELPLIRIPLSLPIYRMANFRTFTRQQTFIKQNEKEQDFFKSGQENEEAQQAQHELLVNFAKMGVEGSITPIVDVLEHDIQKDPLLLTHDGVVVNGNRRLSAMRYLYDEKKKHDFEYIECIILPKDATVDEIRDVEVRLQMQPHTELPYEWVIEAIAARQLMEDKGNDKAVADLMRIRPIDVKDKVFTLELVDDYLNRWLNQSENYQLVEDKEQWFSDLAIKLRKKEPEEQDITRAVAYLLAENSSLLEGRLYNYGNIVGNFLPEVAQKLADRKEIKLEVLQDDPDSLFGDIAEPIFSYIPLIEVLEGIHKSKDSEAIKNIVLEIKETYENTKEKDDDKLKGEHAKNKVVSAHTTLCAVDISEANPHTYTIIQSQLDSIENLVKKLKNDLSELT